MTQKDYIRLARALNRARPPREWPLEYYTWVKVLEELMEELKHDNERFDRKRFMSAANSTQMQQNQEHAH